MEETEVWVAARGVSVQGWPGEERDNDHTDHFPVLKAYCVPGIWKIYPEN